MIEEINDVKRGGSYWRKNISHLIYFQVLKFRKMSVEAE